MSDFTIRPGGGRVNAKGAARKGSSARAGARVGRSGPASGTASGTASGPASGQAFGEKFADTLKDQINVGNGDPAEEASALSDVSSGNFIPVDGMLSIQEFGDAPERERRRKRQKVLQYGDELLDALEDIRMAFLDGYLNKEKLATLALRLRTHTERAESQELQALIEQIELRAEVEIAKLTAKNQPK